MKKNNGWKRASCVLLAAQMTVSVLPMNSMAAYVNGQGRSSAILEASINAKAVHAARSSFWLDKDQMPLLTKHVVSLSSNEAAALDASMDHDDVAIMTDADGPTGTDQGQQDLLTGPSVVDSGPSADTDIEGPSVAPDSSGEDKTNPELSETEGETTTAPPTEETQPAVSPDPDTGEEEEPSVISPGTGEGEGLPEIKDPETELPEDNEPIAPPEQVEATMPAPESPELMAASAPVPLANELTLDMIQLNIYGYSGWTNFIPGMFYHKPGAEGYEFAYPPYNQEIPPGDDGGLNGVTHLEGEIPYTITNFTGNEPSFGDGYGNEKVTALPGLKLSRIPDLRFEGWIFAQINPADRGKSLEAEHEILWNNRYWSESAWIKAGMTEPYNEDPFEPTFEAALAHADVNQTIDYGDQGGFDYIQSTTNVVAKWVESDRADLTKLTLSGLPLDKSTDGDKVKLELYDTDFTAVKQKDQQPVELKTYETGAGTIQDEYYVQVPVHIDRLTLDFTSYEPGTMIKIEADSLKTSILYRYDREDYIWFEDIERPSDGIRTSKEDHESRNVDTDSILTREQPGRGWSEGGSATNSYEDPARANWSLPTAAAIPLELTDTEDVYTDVTITVVAPDGTISETGTISGTTATYTLHVRRMSDPEMKLNPGNTPYGMIAEETRSTWDKDDLRDHFDANRAFPANRAILLDHNGGAVYQGKFSEEAWLGTDYDKSETALVVYQDATFTDPGFTLIDSQGVTVDSTALERSIRLRRVSALTTSCIHEGTGEEVYYQAGALTPASGDVVMESVVTPGGKDQISLKGLRVVPGIYTIEYSYKDPVSQKTYNSIDTSVYMDTTKAAAFSRTLIVLPKPGDIDMDGMITLADAIALENMLSTPSSFVNVDSLDEIERLFKYRVCDVDGDGKVSKADVAKLKNGHVTHQSPDLSTDYFYLNFGYNGEQERNPLTTEPTSTGKAEISVEYLGKSILGVPSGVVNDAEVELNETFWVGVRLKNASALSNSSASVKGFEFTLLYDPMILAPGLLQDTANWQETVEAANLSGESTTPWKDAYALVGNSGPSGSLIPYPELAVPGLAGAESDLRTYTVVLQLKQGATAHSLSEGYLLYIPFTMINHPAGIEHDTVGLVEPAMGGREFSVVYTNGSVAAWSGQNTVFGGSTQDLKTSLAYTGATKIPVGEDKTPCITLYDDDLDENNHVRNARYGEAFQFSSYGNTNADYDVVLLNHDYRIESGSLPPGMSYDPDTGVIATNSASGATRAGVYRFYINGVLYQIIVDKAPLTLTVESTSGRYYGESNPKSSLMEFGYDASQLKLPELERITQNGLNNNGKGSNLEAILSDTGYKRPTIIPVDENGVTLTYKAPAGRYTAELTGGLSTNYVFRYLKQGETEPNKEKATNTFTVSPRPIVIEKIEGPVGKLDSKPVDGNFALDLTARYGTGAGNFVAKFPDDPMYSVENSMEYLSGHPVLDSDELLITYTGEFKRTEKDTKPFEFTLEKEEESRPVEISRVQLAGSEAGNYRIDHWETQETTGTVVLVPVTELKLEGTKFLTTEYTYGDTLALAGLGTIRLKWKNGAEEGPFSYNPTDNLHGVMLCWVDNIGDKPSEAEAYNRQSLTVPGQNGKYLCVYVSNGEKYAPACDYVGPFTVHKAELTLTVDSQSRYYGEPDAEPWITYSYYDLKGEDQKIYQYGLLQELKDNLDGFRDLEISYRETASKNGKVVNQKTDAGDYFVVLSKAEADNYIISYKQPNVATPSKDLGYASMTVVKRPICVDRITGTVGFFYDDTSTNIKSVQGTAPAAENQDFELKITSPTADYCTTDNAAYMQTLGSLTKDPIVAGDTLTFTYRASFDSDNDRKPFFDTSDWSTDTKTYSVTVDNLRLDTTVGSGRNYQIVYSNSESALNGQPEGDDKSSGNVIIRRIDRLEIRPLPQYTDYSYGDNLQLDGSLAVRIYYAPENGRVSYEDVIYYQKKLNGEVVGDTFADNGLRLEWSDKDGNPVEGGGQEAYHGQLTTVIDHDGRYLVVKGRHHESHEEKVVVASKPITVAKKTIYVKARDIQRTYGNENLGGINLDYSVEVDWQDREVGLIPEDWKKLADSGLFDMDGTKTPYNQYDDLSIHVNALATAAASPALTYLDPTYVGPEFRTMASTVSPVGKYELSLSGGQMANYDFEFKPGVIEVTKRMIYLWDIDENQYSLEHPLATMVVGGATKITNVMATYSPSLKEAIFGSSDIVNNDEVTVSMEVEFGYNERGNPIPKVDLTVPDGEVAKAWIKVLKVTLVKGNENYVLGNENLNKTPQVVHLGRIDGRQIDRIEFADPSAIKTQYDYGDSLDLLGLKVNIYYKMSAGAASVTVERNVDVTSRNDLSLHYLPDPTLVNDPRNWADIAEGKYGKTAAADLLCIAPDDSGFAHEGKYLVVSAEASREPGDYVQPIVVSDPRSGAPRPLEITPRTLRYTLTADTKPYDGTTQAWGTVRMDVNQIYPGDVVYVDNGIRYDAMEMEQEGANYIFPSNPTYGVGFRFEFADKNVAYEQTPGHDDYGTLKAVSAGMQGLALSGRDAANYRLERNSVPNNDPAAPSAIITRASRPAPDVAAVTSMSTDIHTNTVMVFVDKEATSCGDRSDFYNKELHYEYQLEYLADETDLASGFIVVAEADRDGRFFGGESVSVTSEEFEAAPGEKNNLTPGMGQPAIEGDSDFGNRDPLPRDTYFRALVRLAGTHNYEPSEYTPSVSDDDMVAAIAAARAAEESDEIDPVLTDPKEIDPPRPIPEKQSLGKSYQYRIDMVAAQTVKGTDNKEHTRTQLDSVWFTDRATYPREDYLNALVTDTEEPRYQAYFWDPKQDHRLHFPLNMEETVVVNMPREDGTTAPESVCGPDTSGTIRLYASLVPVQGGGSSYTLTIVNDDIVAYVGDDPVQLQVRIDPNTDLSLYWYSSDPSVVTVDSNGLLTFVGEGTAQVEVSFGSIRDVITVTVLAKLVLPDTLFNWDYLGAFMEVTDELMFYPERTMSRGELAIILAKVLHPLAQQLEGEAPDYVDMDEDMDCFQAVESLSRLGVMKGVGEGRFAPDQTVTRSEIAVSLVRMGSLPAAFPEHESFLDNSPEDTWAWKEIDALEQAGITKGTGDNYFNPNRYLTRAETAVFLTRMLRYKLDPEQAGLIHPVDVEREYWAWREIMQAVNGVNIPEEDK